MLNNENKRLGYTEVYYNYKADKFFTEDFGNQFKGLDITLSNGGGGGSGIQAGDNISQLTNDANYVVSGANISQLTNDANYVVSGANISTLVNNVGFLTSYSIPSAASLPTANLSFGNLAALSTDNNPYFYDGTAWRRIFLADVPPQAGDPDTDWDKVILRVPFNTNTNDVKIPLAASSSGSQAVITGSPRKYGAGALKVQGASFIYYSGNSVGTFLDNDFTIEFWLYIDSFSPQNQDTGILRKGNTYFYFDFVGFNQMIFKIKLSNTNDPDLSFNTTQNMATGGWHHIAYCRNATSGLCQLFVDGASEGTVNLNNMVDSLSYDLDIGDLINLQADMFMDDLRISNFERYTSNFTAPTAELPTSGS